MATVIIIYMYSHCLPTHTITAKACHGFLPLPAQAAHELLVPVQSENMRISASVAVQA